MMTNTLARLLVLIVAGGIAFTEAKAETVESLVEHGAVIERVTRLSGEFRGCIRNRQLAFVDGTVFVCGERHAHFSYRSSVYILRDERRLETHVVIDDQQYAGVIVRLGRRALRPSRRVAIAPMPMTRVETSTPGIRPLPPMPPIESLNDLGRDLTATAERPAGVVPVQDVQTEELPSD
jgi:hypothetical protein